MKIRLSKDFKEFIKAVERINDIKSDIDLEKTYDVVRREEKLGRELIIIISNGKEEKLPEEGYIVVEG